MAHISVHALRTAEEDPDPKHFLATLVIRDYPSNARIT